MFRAHLPRPCRGQDEAVATIEIGTLVSADLHQVDSPAFDRDGNLFATNSGTRGQTVPVSIFRVRPDGDREPVASGIVNATSLAFDPFGELCVTSRFDGTVYRVKRGGAIERVASDLGVACGLAFAPDGSMYVGDRTGTLFRVNAAGRVIPFATLPPSVAAFHVAIGPDESVYVSGPTLSSRDVVFRVDRRGEVSVFADGFGRPQGLAIDDDGALHVAEALAGASGIYRVRGGGARERPGQVLTMAAKRMTGCRLRAGGALLLTVLVAATPLARRACSSVAGSQNLSCVCLRKFGWT